MEDITQAHTLNEVAEMVGLPIRRLRYLIKKEQIKSFKRGWLVFIPSDQIAIIEKIKEERSKANEISNT